MTTPNALGLILEEARLATITDGLGSYRRIEPDEPVPEGWMVMTQVQIADLLEISRWTYNRLANGHAQLRQDWIKKLPLPIREPVVRYLQQQHTRQVDLLDQWLQPERIKRPTGAVRQEAL
jgi:hypothetical protein